MGNKLSQRYVEYQDWLKEGNNLFGDNVYNWKFICPACGNIQTPKDFKKFKDAGAVPDDAFKVCIGYFKTKNPKKTDLSRGVGIINSIWSTESPCMYQPSLFLNISPIGVIMEDGRKVSVFDFYRLEEG